MPCDYPFQTKTGVSVPCGRCPPCKLRRVNGWVFRLLEEEKVSSSSYFITLTYDTEFVPITDNGFMTLRKSDFQDYMKRLRKLCEGYKLRYYAVGEYGSKRHRPHYHAIVFNVPSDKLFSDAWSLDGKMLGTVFVGKVSTDSIAYCMKYIDKPGRRLYGRRDDRCFEFSLMSKGLGKSYLSDAMVKYHKDDLSRNYCVKDGGYKIALPRYYRNKIYNKSELEEQLFVILDAVDERLLVDRREFDSLCYPESYSFEQWQASKKVGRLNHFYSNLKDRDL